MKKLLIGFLALGSFSAMANNICGKIETVTVSDDRAVIKLFNDEKSYLAFGYVIPTSLITAKAGNLTICLKEMRNNSKSFTEIEIKD